MKEKRLDAAAWLIQQHGLKKFTVDEITAELRISEKTICRYFNSKYDIIQEYFAGALFRGCLFLCIGETGSLVFSHPEFN